MTDPTTLLQCTKCSTEKAETEFDRNVQAVKRNGRHHWCKACRTESWKARYRTDAERFKADSRKRSLKSRYNITHVEYDALFAERGGLCDICKSPEQGKALCVDHDHACCPGERSCGRCIRGLLCNRCNRLLGIAEDNLERLQSALNYLRS